MQLELQLMLETSSSHQDYFSAHGPDALLIARTVYKTTNVIRYLGSATATPSSNSGPSSSSYTNQKKGLPSLTLSTTLAKGFLREALTSKQMRVEIWEGEGGKKQGSRWELGKEVSRRGRKQSSLKDEHSTRLRSIPFTGITG
jgi:hypothetical protein